MKEIITTNASVIRSMTDEQLCRFLEDVRKNKIYCSVTVCDRCNDRRSQGRQGNELDFECKDCFQSWVLGNAYAYNGLLTAGFNDEYVDIKQFERG